jgi:predicted Rossmann-fold nucleotide-binding protein
MSQAAFSDKLWQTKVNLAVGANVGLMEQYDEVFFKWWRNSYWRYSRFFKIKSTHTNGLTELIVVDSMHERKTKWICVAALLLLEGFGTLEEFFFATWSST